MNKEFLAESRGSSLSSERSKQEKEEQVVKENINMRNENVKSKFKQILIVNDIYDIESENDFSSNNKKFQNKNDDYVENFNLKNFDENLNLRKIFTFNENNKSNEDCTKQCNYHEKDNKNTMQNEKEKFIKTRNNIRTFSDKRSPNLDILNDFKEYEEYLEKKIKSVNKSHTMLANYSRELLDLRNKLNDLSTNNNDVDNFSLGKLKEKEDCCIKNDLNENEYIILNSKNKNQYKNSEENRLMHNSKEESNSLKNKNNDNLVNLVFVGDDFESEKISKKITFSKTNKKKSKSISYKRKNFSTDELIYYLFIYSLEKLEEFTESLVKEADSLKGIYLELSEKERKDFFRRIHSMEVSMHIIHQETKMKQKFFKYAKNQFRTYNKLSNDFYFKNNFNFFLELMISKITQIELTFDTLENFLKMIKENYLIIIEDNTEKENVKLNYVMKVLTILTTIYAPMNIIPGLFGMNVKVPFVGSEVDSTNPFVYICFVLILLIFAQLFVFHKLKWL